MAKGKPVGTIFAELDLDTTRFTKGQQKLLKDATSTSLSIEDNFRKLGIKSSAEFDLMRAKIENSYRMIKHSAQATANDILRAEQAKNAQIARLDEMQYGRQLSHLDMLKKNWIAAAAAIGAAMYATGRAWDMLKVGADYAEHRGILDNLARKYDITAASIVQSMRGASEGLVADADLMKIALSGIAKGMKPEQLVGLADAARILGDAAGKDATTALHELTEALETGRARGLKAYIGTALDLKEAFGDLESKMTEAEKAQAMYLITMREAAKLQEQQTEKVNNTADSIERLEASFKNLKHAMADVLVEGVEIYAKYTEWWTKGSRPIIAPLLGIKMPETLESPAGAIKTNANEYQRQIEALKKLLKGRQDAAKGLSDMAKIEEQAYLKEMALFEELEKENAKYLEEMRREQEKFDEALYLSEMERFERLEKENADYLEKMKRQALERFQMERDLYEDIRGYEKSYYDAAVRLIEQQADRYREAGVDEVAVAVWVRQEIIKENIKKAKSGEDFVAGWEAGLEEMRRDAMTWGQGGYEIFKTFAERSRDTLSDVLFDGLKGEMKSFEDYFQSFADSLLRAFTDMISKMIVQWLLLESTTTMGSGLFTLAGGGSGMFFAKGAAFSGGRIIPFADGDVVDRPTRFPMPQGTGLMGEKGPEAIMPLKRLPGGRLGVEAAQPAGNLTISVPVTIAQKNNRMAAELRTEIEETVHKVIRRYS